MHAGFLCPLTANTYDVEFLAFKIRDAETGKVSVFSRPHRAPCQEPRGKLAGSRSFLITAS